MKRLLLPVLLAAVAACGEGHRIVEPPFPGGGSPGPSGPSYPGFDIGVYPGDATLRAWLPPATPYRWVGFYLPAPCHRDTSFHGKLPTMTGMGWGTAAIYVGQQTWEGVPNVATGDWVLGTGLLQALESPRATAGSRMPVPDLPSFTASCSRTLLSAGQGAAEAGDAVAKASAEGFPAGSAIFLDVEYMSTITQPMLDYFGAWVAGVLADARYRPAVYCAASNADALYAAAQQAYTSSKASGAPDFWVASTAGFDLLRRRPTDAGYSFARVWQGVIDRQRSYSGITLSIDEDVAASLSPSAPVPATALAGR